MKRTISIFMAVTVIITLFSTIPFVSANNAASNIDLNDVELTATNSVGEYFADVINETNEINNDYQIINMSIKNGIATLNIKNVDTCLIVVAIYDESTSQMITSEVEEISADAEVVSIPFSLQDLPEYFIAKAFLIDENGMSLCDAYFCNEYSRAYEEFMEATTEDFEEDLVINLDENIECNFIVLNSEAVIVEEDEEFNNLISAEVSKGKYVFDNIDFRLESLLVGDIFCYKSNDIDKTIVIKVKSIDFSSNKATITEEDAGLTEIFDFVKIDVSQMENDVNPQLSTQAQSDPWINYDTGTYTFETSTNPIKKTFGNVTVSGNADLVVNMELKIFVAKNFFDIRNWGDENEVYVKFNINPNVIITLTVSGKLKEKIELFPIQATFWKIVTVSIDPTLVVEASGEITLTGTLSFYVGAEWNSKGGFVDLSRSPVFKPEIKIEGSFYVGMEITPKLYLLTEDVLSMGITGSAGAQIDASLAKEHDGETHECAVCFEGEIFGKYSVEVYLIFAKGVPFIEATPSKKLVDEPHAHIDYFYWSVSKSEFGWGICPYRSTSTPLGKFEFLGTANLTTDNEIELTPLKTWSVGGVWYSNKINTEGSIRINFSYWAGGGRNDSYGGADGFVVLLSNNTYNLGGNGEYLGFVNDTAIGIEFDSYALNPGDPSGKHIAVVKNSTSNHLAYTLDDRVDDSIYHDVSIYIENGKIKVFVDNKLTLSCEYDNFLSSTVYIGIAGATGGGFNRHLIKNFEITRGEITIKQDGDLGYQENLSAQSYVKNEDVRDLQNGDSGRKIINNKVYAYHSNALKKQLYTLLSMKEGCTEITEENLLYIDQISAICDGYISFEYVPMYEENSDDYIIGLFDFGLQKTLLEFVNRDIVIDLSVKSSPNKQVYTIGEKFDSTGIILSATYSSGITRDITTGYIVGEFNSSDIGQKEVPITYGEKTVIIFATVTPLPVEIPTTEPTTKPIEEPTTKPEESTTKPTESTTKPEVTTIPADEVEIKEPSQTKINYGDKIVLHVDVELPEGAKVVWTADNENFSYEVSADGKTCTISPEKSGDTTFTATVVDKDGNVISEEYNQTMTSNAGFFQKIIAFFKSLFGLTKVIPEAVKFVF